MGFTKDSSDKPLYNNDITDPVGQFQAAVDYAQLVGTRRKGTTAQREVARTKLQDGDEFFDTTEQQAYIKQGTGYVALGRTTVHSVRGNPKPSADTNFVHKYQFFDGLRTNGSSVLYAPFTSPFPNGVVGMWATTINFSGSSPVINQGLYSTAGAEWAFKDTPNTVVQFWVHAVGW